MKIYIISFATRQDNFRRLSWDARTKGYDEHGVDWEFWPHSGILNRAARIGGPLACSGGVSASLARVADARW